MTAQTPERLVFEGREHPMFSEPLSDFLRSGSGRPEFQMQSTACWRGYIGTWEVIGRRLYLVKLEGRLKSGEKANLAAVFPSSEERVFARWFSGIIQLPQGDEIEYLHIGFASIYERDLLLRFEDGELVDRRLRVNGETGSDAPGDCALLPRREDAKLAAGPGHQLWEQIERAAEELSTQPKTFAALALREFYYTEGSVRIARKIRALACPSEQLKKLQRSILTSILDVAAPHKQATAFFRGCSIIQNARQHHNKHYMFKTDIRSFFGSITTEDITTTLRRFIPNLSQKNLEALTKVLSCDGTLPQGAPTSPHVSNLHMRDFDELVSSQAKKHKCSYTRYADDIAVSSDNKFAVHQMSEIVGDALGNARFTQNTRKTHLLGKFDRKIVTGLDVSGDHIRPTKKFRKTTKAMVRVFIVHDRKAMLPNIQSRLAFWRSIRPDDPEMLQLRKSIASA
ncbi:reverse transcriptase family protein [Parafrankia sp. BMG5.11]|uniref:reverse transcriptase family protein n=1 Tax=Parafrankia sp. BMG5.11 TaxID=222540 RepID=UPI00103E91B4|nr:reverse transcriptase family protein [Parafrankia sp. BMG5.11]TCJ37386.1 RNA-directed DNA polymerase [Parafrankia sp. BMG5.11]